jgi:hypothetical protein
MVDITQVNFGEVANIRKNADPDESTGLNTSQRAFFLYHIGRQRSVSAHSPLRIDPA